jgi:xanthine dehydrogenase accessory factor
VADIGSRVIRGETIASIDGSKLAAPISGLIRGMIRNRTKVTQGLKVADIDPRTDEANNCYTISDKARCISGSVLEALLFLTKKKTS